MDKTKYLKWDISKLKTALELNEEDVKKYFTDGRRVSFLTERMIVKNTTESFHQARGLDMM